ncbi:hypothetical protein HYPGJ_30171 [Hyphomicrobium sp. GJ21]|nr:hypothetical protein HYPGJ_30171 [Hyphomicrobium sp. GJ21]
MLCRSLELTPVMAAQAAIHAMGWRKSTPD